MGTDMPGGLGAMLACPRTQQEVTVSKGNQCGEMDTDHVGKPKVATSGTAQNLGLALAAVLACCATLTGCSDSGKPPRGESRPSAAPSASTRSQTGEQGTPSDDESADEGTCDESKKGGAGPWRSVASQFRDYLKSNGTSEDDDLAAHVKDAKMRECPEGDVEVNVLVDYDPHLEAPHVSGQALKQAKRVGEAFTEWRDSHFSDEGWVYVINGAVETITKKAW
ncbi:hypothetical protein ACFZB6_12245 [Streptomyces syringium]|uniref:hypothetical protein n=1 Tax=Streptomyces syringium TaxID=76729 RepID=UPI0036E1B852